MKTVLITGGEGFVGSRMACHLVDSFRVLAPGHSELDVTDPVSVGEYICRVRPDRIVHAGALSNTGYCQQHPEESEQVNVIGAENMARAAHDLGAGLVFFSSDQVYNGCQHDYPQSEEEPLCPVNVYGKHKLEAEQRVMNACPGAVCLRASWMYDLPVQGLKNNLGIVGQLYRAALSGKALPMNPAEWRGITWVETLIRQMEAIMKLPGGIYNAGAEAGRNSFENGQEMARMMGLPAEIVCRADYPRRNLSMNTDKLRQYGIDLGDTTEGLRSCLAAYRL